MTQPLPRCRLVFNSAFEAELARLRRERRHREVKLLGDWLVTYRQLCCVDSGNGKVRVSLMGIHGIEIARAAVRAVK